MKLSCLEKTRLNGLKAGWMAWSWLNTSSLNCMKAVQAGWMLESWPDWHQSWLNAYKEGGFASQTQSTLALIVLAICTGFSWFWLARQTSKDSIVVRLHPALMSHGVVHGGSVQWEMYINMADANWMGYYIAGKYIHVECWNHCFHIRGV